VLKIFSFIFLLINLGKPSEKEDLTGYDIELFKNTPVWELALAVKHQNTHTIESFCKEHSSLTDYQEKKIGITLLGWAVFNDKYRAAKALLIAGANPNFVDSEGVTPFILAAEKYNNADYVRLLLEYGGNVNTTALASGHVVHTPLMAAVSSSLESVKILVEGGADINYYDGKEYLSAIGQICYGEHRIDILHYLIIEKGADFKKPVMRTMMGEFIYPLEKIKGFRFKLNSKEEKMQKEVIAYIEAHS
jgi:hypothetical protein